MTIHTTRTLVADDGKILHRKNTDVYVRSAWLRDGETPDEWEEVVIDWKRDVKND